MIFAYAAQFNPAVEIAMALDYNPKMMLGGPGVNTDNFHRDIFSPEIAHGIMGWGGWNAKSNPAAAAFLDMFLTTSPGVNVDWWGHIWYFVILEVFEQALISAGTLDNLRVSEVLATETFDTSIGPIWYVNNSIAREAYLGNIGQWQYNAATGEMVYEVVDVDRSQRTADPIVPKPPWPR
jgi:ABC-type branched-subunit amino acid transport system substrate-binding protein